MKIITLILSCVSLAISAVLVAFSIAGLVRGEN